MTEDRYKSLLRDELRRMMRTVSPYSEMSEVTRLKYIEESLNKDSERIKQLVARLNASAARKARLEASQGTLDARAKKAIKDSRKHAREVRAQIVDGALRSRARYWKPNWKPGDKVHILPPSQPPELRKYIRIEGLDNLKNAFKNTEKAFDVFRDSVKKTAESFQERMFNSPFTDYFESRQEKRYAACGGPGKCPLCTAAFEGLKRAHHPQCGCLICRVVNKPKPPNGTGPIVELHKKADGSYGERLKIPSGEFDTDDNRHAASTENVEWKAKILKARAGDTKVEFDPPVELKSGDSITISWDPGAEASFSAIWFDDLVPMSEEDYRMLFGDPQQEKPRGLLNFYADRDKKEKE